MSHQRNLGRDSNDKNVTNSTVVSVEPEINGHKTSLHYYYWRHELKYPTTKCIRLIAIIKLITGFGTFKPNEVEETGTVSGIQE
jgi:hypothetical protein